MKLYRKENDRVVAVLADGAKAANMLRNGWVDDPEALAPKKSKKAKKAK